MSKKRLILLILAGILVVFLIYYILFYAKKCSDAGCFAASQAKCSKAVYLNDANDATWIYNIKGKKKGECEINVKLLQAKTGTAGLAKIEGLDMECYLPLGFTGSPQADLSLCHGLLKEGMQEMLIQKMHSYIISNLGVISEELESVL